MELLAQEKLKLHLSFTEEFLILMCMIQKMWVSLFRKNIPSRLEKDDFQDFEMWREFNFSMLKYINDNYKGTIIVPMTVVNQKYFKDIVEKLRVDNIEVKHFVLWASKETLLKRLKSRAEGSNSLNITTKT